MEDKTKQLQTMFAATASNVMIVPRFAGLPLSFMRLRPTSSSPQRWQRDRSIGLLLS